jgi:hypothetical protein
MLPPSSVYYNPEDHGLNLHRCKSIKSRHYQRLGVLCLIIWTSFVDYKPTHRSPNPHSDFLYRKHFATISFNWG